MTKKSMIGKKSLLVLRIFKYRKQRKQEMSDYIEHLETSIKFVVSNDKSELHWRALESALKNLREVDQGGSVDSNYLDDNLDRLLDDQAKILRSIFHISKLQPTSISNDAIREAQRTFRQVVTAIERAVIVARIRGNEIQQRLSPVISEHLRSGSLSPTPKCK